MAIKLNKQDIDRAFNELEQFQNHIDEVVIYNLNYLGMQLMAYAKTHKTFVDRSGNLVNSIGYAVLKKGEISVVNFEAETRGPEFKPGDDRGELVGENFVRSIAEQFPADYTLVVVAGMDYASYVEDVHGLDVLNSSKVYAPTVLPKVLSLIQNQLKNHRK